MAPLGLWEAANGDSVWDSGRKHGALTTFKVKEGRLVDRGEGCGFHQGTETDISGYLHWIPTGCGARASPEIKQSHPRWYSTETTAPRPAPDCPAGELI